jgi:two-component system KDP operon response regulator KdpE
MARLIVFEDEPNIRRLLSVLFQGYDILFRTDGADALDIIAEHHPAVIVLDLKLPKVSGVEILEALRADPRFQDLAIVVISGSMELLGRPPVQQSTTLLKKPFDIFELKAIVDHHLGVTVAN